ncbi:flagellar hook-length control protein FliK [Photobacterium sagamiensis]|uniref:flagellar hook-length control protein FliK n=1 Tax=Photobacterium sagamiensis TaxID=2910241 RepID=UPI003D127509
MNSSSLLSADFSTSLPRSGEGKVAVEGKATAESVKGDPELSATSSESDSFANELKNVISDEQDTPATAAKKANSDNIDSENQELGSVSASNLATDTDSDAVSDDVQLAEVKQSAEVSKIRASGTDSEQISGKQAGSQETALDPEGKQQIMADGEELLNRLSAANQQLSEPHSTAGKTLPPAAITSDMAKPLMNKTTASMNGEAAIDTSVDIGNVAATTTMAAGEEDLTGDSEPFVQNASAQFAGLPLSEADVQNKSELSQEQLANVFAVPSAQVTATDSQASESLPISEGIDRQVIDPQVIAGMTVPTAATAISADPSAELTQPQQVSEDIDLQVIAPQVIAGMAEPTAATAQSGGLSEQQPQLLAATDGEQAVGGKVTLPADMLPAEMQTRGVANETAGLSKPSLTTSELAMAALASTSAASGAAATPATVVNGTVQAAPVDGAPVIPWATTSASPVLAGAMVMTAAGAADPTAGDTALIDTAMNSAALAATVDASSSVNAETKPADLSHQISSLSGQQSINGQAKSEALAQAQSPLQLSKEQAGDQVAERVNMMMSKNLKHVDIRLDPPELGKLQIKLSVNQDQASVQFTVGNQQTRDLIEQAMPRLREMLHQQGLQLAQSTVQQDGSRQQLAGQSGQQGGTQQHSDGSHQTGSESEMGHSGSEAVEMFVKQADDRVDYYA